MHDDRASANQAEADYPGQAADGSKPKKQALRHGLASNSKAATIAAYPITTTSKNAPLGYTGYKLSYPNN